MSAVCPPAPHKYFSHFYINRANITPKVLNFGEIVCIEIKLNCTEWTFFSTNNEKWHKVQACCKLCKDPSNPFRESCKKAHFDELKDLLNLSKGINANRVFSCICVSEFSHQEFREQLLSLCIPYKYVK